MECLHRKDEKNKLDPCLHAKIEGMICVKPVYGHGTYVMEPPCYIIVNNDSETSLKSGISESDRSRTHLDDHPHHRDHHRDHHRRRSHSSSRERHTRRKHRNYKEDKDEYCYQDKEEAEREAKRCFLSYKVYQSQELTHEQLSKMTTLDGRSCFDPGYLSYSSKN